MGRAYEYRYGKNITDGIWYEFFTNGLENFGFGHSVSLGGNMGYELFNHYVFLDSFAAIGIAGLSGNEEDDMSMFLFEYISNLFFFL